MERRRTFKVNKKKIEEKTKKQKLIQIQKTKQKKQQTSRQTKTKPNQNIQTNNTLHTLNKI